MAAPASIDLVAQAAEVDVIAVGKAAGPMLTALGDCLGRPWRSALAIAPTSAPRQWPATTWIEAAHPVPDARSEAAGRAALALASRTRSNDLLLVLMSGGASSLMAVPAVGVPLADKCAAQRVLLSEGAEIHELNAVRKHLSDIKGGRLAKACRARVLTFALSDVVGGDLPTIGSGPTVADPTTFAQALQVLTRRGGVGRYPAAVVRYLEGGCRGEHAETPKALDTARVQAHVVGSLANALDAAAATAAQLGYRVHRVAEPVVGEARRAGPELLRAATRASADGRPCCLLGGGETTVTVVGSGTGGRNQEVALSMVPGLEEMGPAVAASIGTDGIDGPTDAAGAIVDSTTAVRARARGLTPSAFLDDNNSYAFWSALGDLVKTGPTGTNVGDMQLVLMAPEDSMRP